MSRVQPRAKDRSAERQRERLGGGLLEVGDEVVAVLVLLQASERHLGTGDVLWKEGLDGVGGFVQR